jgi:hypothetical protein
MEQKNAALMILSVVAIIAIVGLVLFFKGAQTGDATAGRGVRYGMPPLKEIVNPAMLCEQAAKEGKVPGMYTLEVHSAQGLAERGGMQYCAKAPASIAPVLYCCHQQRPN